MTPGVNCTFILFNDYIFAQIFLLKSKDSEAGPSPRLTLSIGTYAASASCDDDLCWDGRSPSRRLKISTQDFVSFVLCDSRS